MISLTATRVACNAPRLIAIRAPLSVALGNICEISKVHKKTVASYPLSRCFHGSAYVSAKNGKGSKSDKDDVDDVPIILPDIKNIDAQMEKKIARLSDEFAKLRSGQPNTELFRTVMVDSGGGRVSVADSGQLTIKSPTKMVISVFDPSLVSAVCEAIRECGMGLTPAIDGNSVSMSIPKPSKEAKEALCKTASKVADKVSFNFFLLFS